MGQVLGKKKEGRAGHGHQAVGDLTSSSRGDIEGHVDDDADLKDPDRTHLPDDQQRGSSAAIRTHSSAIEGSDLGGGAYRVAAGTVPPGVVSAHESPRVHTKRDKWLLRQFPGAKIPEALLCIVVGIILYCAVPKPAQLDAKAWGLFSIFIATILGLILEPLPVAPVALAGVTVALWTTCMTYPEAFSAFGNDTIWLILSAFFFAKGVEVTGLGERVADVFIWALGRSSLGLAYALALAELLLCLCMPSTTARAAGVFVPIITSLSRSFGSYPKHPTSKVLGEFLFMSQAQVSSATSTMFLLGAAQTPAALQLAANEGVEIPNLFGTYLKGSFIPAAILIVLVPLVVYLLHTPDVKQTPWAPKEARERMRARGKLSWREWVMAGTLLAAVVLWCTSSYFPFKLSNASVALLGVVVLLASGAITWSELLEHKAAWDLLIWLSILFSMCGALSKFGVIGWISDSLSKPLLATGISTLGLFWLLHILYYLIHYVIAGQAAHVTALYPPFLKVMISAGVDPQLAALTLAYNTNLFGSINQYASAQAAAYYGAGYFALWKLWATGGVVGILMLGTLLTVGMGWWRAVGIWPK